LKYYYALLHLLDEIHKLPECPDPERPASESADRKCPTPEHFDYYRKHICDHPDVGKGA
jgi:hypothetical protein